MKTSLKPIFIGLALLGVVTSGTAVAQHREGGPEWRQGPPSAEETLARMSQALDLSDQQALDLLVVLQKHAAERAALQEQTMALMGPEICAQKASAEDDILTILTPEQTEQFLEIKAERKAKAGQRNRGRESRGPDCSQYEADD